MLGTPKKSPAVYNRETASFNGAGIARRMDSLLLLLLQHTTLSGMQAKNVGQEATTITTTAAAAIFMSGSRSSATTYIHMHLVKLPLFQKKPTGWLPFSSSLLLRTYV